MRTADYKVLVLNSEDEVIDVVSFSTIKRVRDWLNGDGSPKEGQSALVTKVMEYYHGPQPQAELPL